VSALRPPFPEHLRRPRRRRVRVRRLLLPLAAAATLAAAPAWRVGTVSVRGGEALPPCARARLEALAGEPVLLLDPEGVRERLERLPGVARAAVRRELDGRLEVTVETARAVASVPVGRGWHGVSATGALCGRLPGPRPPVLLGFPAEPRALRAALAAVERLRALGLGPVRSLRRTLPDVLVARTGPRGGREVRLAAEPTASERWLAGARPELAAAAFLDLTRDDRVVVRRGATG